MKTCSLRSVLLGALLWLGLSSFAWAVDWSTGSLARLDGPNSAGVPVRNTPDDSHYFRWPIGTQVKIVQDTGRWVQIESEGTQVWLLEKYLVPHDDEGGDEGTEVPTICVGAWNLEFLCDSATRGFPEIKNPKLQPRTYDDYRLIAAAIRDRLRVDVLALSEINGIRNKRESVELARLVELLGSDWSYLIGSSGGIGGKQRVAIIYNASTVDLIESKEITVPKTEVDGDDIFDRDPLTAFFRAKRSSGPPATDFMVVALHLASGQSKWKNHNAAMERFRADLHAALASDPALTNEDDIFLGGDLNASRYDRHQEDFWVGFDASALSFTTLSPLDGDEYPATRVNGSQIDYLFASKGLTSHLTFPLATVHQELADNDFASFRLHYSDHFPVTCSVIVEDDDD